MTFPNTVTLTSGRGTWPQYISSLIPKSSNVEIDGHRLLQNFYMKYLSVSELCHLTEACVRFLEDGELEFNGNRAVAS